MDVVARLDQASHLEWLHVAGHFTRLLLTWLKRLGVERAMPGT